LLSSLLLNPELFFNLPYMPITGIEELASFFCGDVGQFLSSLLFKSQPSNSVF
jgi:hypothetical protein